MNQSMARKQQGCARAGLQGPQPTFSSTTDVRSPLCGSDSSSKRRLLMLKTPMVPSPLREMERPRGAGAGGSTKPAKGSASPAVPGGQQDLPGPIQGHGADVLLVLPGLQHGAALAQVPHFELPVVVARGQQVLIDGQHAVEGRAAGPRGSAEG